VIPIIRRKTMADYYKYDYELRWRILEELLSSEIRTKRLYNLMRNRRSGLRDVQALMVAISNGEYQKKLNQEREKERGLG
jgi:hypothetical protein